MDESQMRQVVEWFRARVGPVTCSVCSHTDFKFDAELTALPVWRDKPHPHADVSDGTPAVVVICSHCGSLRLFSAAKIGITSASTRTPPSDLARPHGG